MLEDDEEREKVCVCVEGVLGCAMWDTWQARDQPAHQPVATYIWFTEPSAEKSSSPISLSIFFKERNTFTFNPFSALERGSLLTSIYDSFLFDVYSWSVI